MLFSYLSEDLSLWSLALWFLQNQAWTNDIRSMEEFNFYIYRSDQHKFFLIKIYLTWSPWFCEIILDQFISLSPFRLSGQNAVGPPAVCRFRRSAENVNNGNVKQFSLGHNF
jgi:hypothetical protein